MRDDLQPLYFSKTDHIPAKFISVLLCPGRNVSGEIVSSHLAGLCRAWVQQAIGRAGDRMLGSVRFFYLNKRVPISVD